MSPLRRDGPAAGPLLAVALAAAVAVALLSGCGSVTRHDVLTFFFTGVPAPGEEEKPEPPVNVSARRAAMKGGKPAAAGLNAADAKPGDTKASVATERAPRARQGVVVKSTRYGHGPFVANMCYACHEMSASGGFRGLGKKEEAAGALAKPGIVPGKMVAPLRELCTRCHEGKLAETAQRAGLSVHGPVAGGLCVLCHAPHAAEEQYMLLKKTDALCVGCHAAGYIANKTVHENRADCSACHNPHVGKDWRMLRAEYKEIP